jgi:hypothetical protein
VRVYALTCCAQKSDKPGRARDVYQSDLFKKSLAWCENATRHSHAPIVILSAKYGVLEPDDWIEPYDLSLDSMNAEESAIWADETRSELYDRFGNDTIFTAIAGAGYITAFKGFKLENVISAYGRYRRFSLGYSGRKAVAGIGVIKKYLAQGFNPFSGGSNGG